MTVRASLVSSDARSTATGRVIASPRSHRRGRQPPADLAHDLVVRLALEAQRSAPSGYRQPVRGPRHRRQRRHRAGRHRGGRARSAVASRTDPRPRCWRASASSCSSSGSTKRGAHPQHRVPARRHRRRRADRRAARPRGPARCAWASASSAASTDEGDTFVEGVRHRQPACSASVRSRSSARSRTACTATTSCCRQGGARRARRDRSWPRPSAGASAPPPWSCSSTRAL